MNHRKIKKERVEVLAGTKPDRRLLSKVPDPDFVRTSADRRGSKHPDLSGVVRDAKDENDFSARYVADFPAILTKDQKAKDQKIHVRVADISVTGVLLEVPANLTTFEKGETYFLRFTIPPGTIPEGLESKVKMDAKVVRTFIQEVEGKEKWMVAFEFSIPLFVYHKKRRWGYSLPIASILLLMVTVFVLLMRLESIIYLKYNFILYLYSIIAAVFLLSRYLFGAFYKDVPINSNFTPGVSIVIPCFNEEEWIGRTIKSCINQDYPIDKLEVIVVDDCSSDQSVKVIQQTIDLLHKEAARFKTVERVHMLALPENKGKREALVKGVEIAKHDLVVFVDSDSFLESTAIINIVQPFQDPKMGGVAGRTDVENKYTNTLTKLQTVRYYIAFRVMKAAESIFDSVTCLSGPLSCYRKDLVLKHKEDWLNQKFFGHPATFGDDRSMTNYILRTHRTGYQDSAICSTIAPSKTTVFLKQQMRWKRSWLRESLRAASFIWRKEPLMSLFFYIGLLVPIAAPAIVVHNLIYVPLVHGIFPTTFLLGLLLMSLLMSFSHLMFRRSNLWIFGIVFCLYYELVLLWQMPIAWFTFWKSTWGTRMTPQDMEADEKRKARKLRNKKRFSLPL
ncbi:glycosyltransferase [Bacillus sp. EB106-08-02-XG196]|uniref:glycosyltransferase n=1 Tax=Bacillus sp. EB106-08-02-XG196 TaxID=2737049 RepID=UPI0015C49152|nr:glycosyltransferase [Bacillus sp. EB106-08-02-XG196]NWQ41779.1 glycosyltransferase [Bacillus sp. EB106-08-02-XG196]